MKEVWKILCPYKMTGRGWALTLWFVLSLCSLCIADDSPWWVLLLVVVNFAAAAYCLRFIVLEGGDDDE